MACDFRYQHIRSREPNEKPSVSYIREGEIAVNIAADNERLFLKNTRNEIVEFITESKINEKIASIDLTDLKHDINSISGSVNTLSGDISDVANNVSTISGDVNTIDNSINTLSGNVNTINGNVNSINNNITSLSSNVNTLNRNINSIENNINIIDDDINSINDDVSTLNSSVNNIMGIIGEGGSIDDRIDTAVLEEKQRAIEAENNRYTKAQTYTKQEIHGLVDSPHQNYVTVVAYNDLPESGSTDTIYRVSSYDGNLSQEDETMYSEYAWDGTQYVFLCVKSQINEVFDISVYNNNATYATFEDALGIDGENVPESVRRGGMTVKYVQTSDEKYVQYRLLTQNWSSNISSWLQCDSISTFDRPSVDLEISDEEGNTLVRFQDGHIRTKNFDSNDPMIKVKDSKRIESDLEVADKNGNILVQCKNGHIRTKNFDSNNPIVNVKASKRIESDLEITDENGNILIQCKDGHIRTKNFDSSVSDDSSTISIVDGVYIDCSNGFEVTSNTYNSTSFIKIKPNEKFQIPVFNVSSLSLIGLAFYNVNKQYVHGIPYPYTTPSTYKSERYIAPDNAMYVRYTLEANQNAYIYDESNYPVAPYFRIYKAAASTLNYKGKMKPILSFGNGVILASSGDNKKSTSDNVHIYRSIDWGSTWTYMGNATQDLNLQEGLYYGDHNGNGTAIIGTGDLSRQSLLKVTNYGENWNTDYRVCLNKTQMDNLVGVSTNGCECVIYVGNNTFRALCNSSSTMRNGAVIESNDNGQNWSLVSTQNPLKASARSIFRTSKGVLWAVGMKNEDNQGVWKSEDNGINWFKKDTFLAFQSIIEFNGNLYCGSMNSSLTEAYVYMSKDDGETWNKVFTVNEGWSVTYHRAFIPYGNMLAAAFCEGEGSTSIKTALYVTYDNGNTWGKISNGREGCYDGGFVELRAQFGETMLLGCNSGIFKL